MPRFFPRYHISYIESRRTYTEVLGRQHIGIKSSSFLRKNIIGILLSVGIVLFQ
jgi:hypothetical protein